MSLHPAWLPDRPFLAGLRVAVASDHPLADTVREEVVRAGGVPTAQSPPAARSDPAAQSPPATQSPPAARPHPAARSDSDSPADLTFTAGPGGDGFTLTRDRVIADGPRGMIYGLFELARGGSPGRHEPTFGRRMIDHWDNVDVHPVMGQVERGYSGGSIFWENGVFRGSTAAGSERIGAYARLLAAAGVNAVTINNVNVHATEARLLTDRRDEVAAIAEQFRRYGISTHLSVNFFSPMILGGLPTADPLDPGVRRWWASVTSALVSDIPDFGGFLVKADSEGQPGPFTYGRSHAEGANMLAAALAPHGAVVHWRAFVYNHRQDWRDRTTDRARAAYDHFAPLDGRFADNVIVQVKHGPIDFQPREPLSPVLTAMPHTRLAVELQVTQEYTGQQKHVCYLAPMWSEVLAQVSGEVAAVSNVGDDRYWTGHPLAQANLYAAGRLAWNPDPIAVLDEWIDLTFPAAPSTVRDVLHELMDSSMSTYEQYTAPLGVGFMVRPGHHYGPDVDGYEYTPWGTYHFADRDGVGVDRTSATGTAFAAQYPHTLYESPATCPDELLLFFHHVPYTHVLHSGSTVIQHIYDTHFAGAARVATMRDSWRTVADLVGPDLHARVSTLLDEQLRSAVEWRDQINTYFFRKSGIPDTHGRPIH